MVKTSEYYRKYETVTGRTLVAQKFRRRWYVYLVGRYALDSPERIADNLLKPEMEKLWSQLIESDLRNTVLELAADDFMLELAADDFISE